jgi:hypothetical protein
MEFFKPLSAHMWNARRQPDNHQIHNGSGNYCGDYQLKPLFFTYLPNRNNQIEKGKHDTFISIGKASNGTILATSTSLGPIKSWSPLTKSKGLLIV